MKPILLHHSKLSVVCEKGKEVTIRYYSLKDKKEIVFENWVVSSFHSSGTTLNIMNPVSGQVRKLTRILILAVNNAEIYI